MSERPPLTDDEISAEIDELGRRNAEAIRRASRAPHPWDEWDVNGSGPPPIAAELERRRASLTVQDIRRLGVPPSVHSDYELGPPSNSGTRRASCGLPGKRPMTERGVYSPPRPWCMPCGEMGSRVTATEYGLCCEWHLGILSDVDREAVRLAVLERHPRGGRIRRSIDQLWVVRVTLRQGLTGPNNVEAIWQADADEQVANEAEDYAAAQAAEDRRMALVGAGATGEGEPAP